MADFGVERLIVNRFHRAAGIDHGLGDNRLADRIDEQVDAVYRHPDGLFDRGGFGSGLRGKGASNSAGRNMVLLDKNSPQGAIIS